jgi:hypothetical protein
VESERASILDHLAKHQLHGLFPQRRIVVEIADELRVASYSDPGNSVQGRDAAQLLRGSFGSSRPHDLPLHAAAHHDRFPGFVYQQAPFSPKS